MPARPELRDGCLWLAPEGEAPRIAVWEQSMALDLTDSGKVAVMNRFGAKVFADSDVVLMGLQPGEVAPPKDVVGADGCPGPYRVVRGIVAREVWDKQRHVAAVAGRTQELGSRAAAEADYAADMARVAELKAWRAQALAEHGDVIASIYVNEDQGAAHMFHTDALTSDELVPETLRPFVTGQVVSQGGQRWRRASGHCRQIAAAGLDARVSIEEIGGFVDLYPADLAALSQAAVAGKITFPPLVRIMADNQSAIYRQDIPLRRDPEAIWYPLEAHPDFATIRALVEETPIMRPEPSPTDHNSSIWVARKPSRAGSLQQTHWLIASGYTREIQALRAANRSHRSVRRHERPPDDREARLTATDIVVAEPAGIDIADGGDGFPPGALASDRSAERYAKPGDELRQRLASGNAPMRRRTLRAEQ